jgi:hypothetical protein
MHLIISILLKTIPPEGMYLSNEMIGETSVIVES